VLIAQIYLITNGFRRSAGVKSFFPIGWRKKIRQNAVRCSRIFYNSGGMDKRSVKKNLSTSLANWWKDFSTLIFEFC